MERYERKSDGAMPLCREKVKRKRGFTLIEMIACLLLLSMFFLLLPRLHVMGIENTHSKGLNEWEWDVFLGQMQLEFGEVLSGRKIALENDGTYFTLPTS